MGEERGQHGLYALGPAPHVPEAPARRILLRDGRGRVIRGDHVHRTAPDTIPKGLDGLPRPHGGRALQDAPQPLQWRPPRPLELDVETLAGGSDLFTQQKSPAVAEHGEMPELMPGIGLSDGVC